MPLTEEQRTRLETLLLKDRRRIVRRLARHNERFADAAQDEGRFAFSFHLADQGSDAMERETAFLLASEEGRMLSAIDAALRRLYSNADGYGRCESCTDAIAFERLEAVPYATRCIECQVEREQSDQGS